MAARDRPPKLDELAKLIESDPNKPNGANAFLYAFTYLRGQPMTADQNVEARRQMLDLFDRITAEICQQGGSEEVDWMRAYLAEKRQPAKLGKRGSKPIHRQYRDAAIRKVIANIERLYQIPPTRNEASTLLSGCLIVTGTLELFGIHLTERAVEKVWEKRPENRPKN